MGIFIYSPKLKTPMRKIFLIIIVFALLAQLASAAEIPLINSYVTDKAGILSLNTKSQLENELRSLEKDTNGVQFVIFIENEYPKEYSLEEYTLKIAETNKIGKKGNDNGILLYVAIKDRKYRWETGYGAESTLNSALLGRISREYLVPNFKAGNYEAGILQAVDVVKRILMGSNDADIAAIKSEATIGKWSFVFGFILIILILIILFAAFNKMEKLQKGQKKKHKDDFYRGAATGLFFGSLGRGGRGSGGFGGLGGFSGGGGGFGGGGGGGGWKMVKLKRNIILMHKNG